MNVKADSTMDLKVRRVFALETIRNHTGSLHMRKRFLELTCSNVKLYPAILCVDMVHLGFSIFLFPKAGRLDSHVN